MKALFKTDVHVTGGRDGRAVAGDGMLDVAMTFPAALGGSGAGTNPEQLFAAGFAGCFASSLRFAAKGMGLDPGPVEVTATVTLVQGDDGAYGIVADLLTATPGLTGPDRARVLAEASRICAYSNALRGVGAVTVT